MQVTMFICLLLVMFSAISKVEQAEHWSRQVVPGVVVVVSIAVLYLVTLGVPGAR